MAQADSHHNRTNCYPSGFNINKAGTPMDLYLCLLFHSSNDWVNWLSPLYKVLPKNTTSKHQHWDLHFHSLTSKRVSTNLAILCFDDCLLPWVLVYSSDLFQGGGMVIVGEFPGVDQWWEWASNCCWTFCLSSASGSAWELRQPPCSRLWGLISSQAKFTDILPCSLPHQSPPS